MTDTPTLDYQRLESDEPPPRPTLRPATPAAKWFLLVLTAVVVHTAVRVEVLNVLAGQPLPHKEGQWRSLASPARAWRQSEARIRQDPTLETRLLTSTEEAEQVAFVRRHSAHNSLYDTLCTWGLAQHLLAPFACLLALYRRVTEPPGRWRVVFTICAGIAAGCTILMLFRGYFSVMLD